MKEIYQTSINGICYEINIRRQTLRRLKFWYSTLARPYRWGDYEYSISTFYERGIKCLRELKRLEKIRDEMIFIMHRL